MWYNTSVIRVISVNDMALNSKRVIITQWIKKSRLNIWTCVKVKVNAWAPVQSFNKTNHLSNVTLPWSYVSVGHYYAGSILIRPAGWSSTNLSSNLQQRSVRGLAPASCLKVIDEAIKGKSGYISEALRLRLLIELLLWSGTASSQMPVNTSINTSRRDCVIQKKKTKDDDEGGLEKE